MSGARWPAPRHCTPRGGLYVGVTCTRDPASRVDSTQTHNLPPSDGCVRASARARGIVWLA